MRKVGIGIIGCGGFVRHMHVPILKANPKFRIHATMDIVPEIAQSLAEDTGAAYSTTELARILEDPAVDAVIVTTRHDSHAALSIEAAHAGKHILCEKPMALDMEECRAVAAAVRESGVKYAVGYNRGMAPMVERAREMLAGQSGKKMIYHRIQAHFPASHWTHVRHIGGGRFVGEGCHIFDLLCRLTGSDPVSVYAAGGTFLQDERVQIPDSAVVTLTFADGSVATTLINSAGCGDFPKEATEIYCDGRAIYISDFSHMEYYGYEGQKKAVWSLGAADKGHAIELDRFADAILQDGEPPNGLETAARAALISYLVDESVQSGSPVPIARAQYSL